MREFSAEYHINCGETGLGGVFQAVDEQGNPGEKRKEKIYANSPQEAMAKALRLQVGFSLTYLSDPTIGITRVKLLSLKDSKGNPLNQRQLNPFGDIECMSFEGDCAVFNVGLKEKILYSPLVP